MDKENIAKPNDISSMISSVTTMRSNAKTTASVPTISADSLITAEQINLLQTAINSLQKSFSGNCCQSNCCQTCETCQACQSCQKSSSGHHCGCGGP